MSMLLPSGALATANKINKSDFPPNHPFNQQQKPVELLLEFTRYDDGNPSYEHRTEKIALVPASSKDHGRPTGHVDGMRGEVRFSQYTAFTSAVIVGEPTDADYQYCAFRVEPFENEDATDEEKLGPRIVVGGRSLNPGGYGIVCFAYWRNFQDEQQQPYNIRLF